MIIAMSLQWLTNSSLEVCDLEWDAKGNYLDHTFYKDPFYGPGLAQSQIDTVKWHIRVTARQTWPAHWPGLELIRKDQLRSFINDWKRRKLRFTLVFSNFQVGTNPCDCQRTKFTANQRLFVLQCHLNRSIKVDDVIFRLEL